MEIKSLKGIKEMNGTINSIRKYIQEESVNYDPRGGFWKWMIFNENNQPNGWLLLVLLGLFNLLGDLGTTGKKLPAIGDNSLENLLLYLKFLRQS